MTDASDLARLSDETAWVRALARRLVRDSHAAEDLAQDGLVAALEERGPIGSLRAFVATVLRRAAHERGRETAARQHRERRLARPEALPQEVRVQIAGPRDGTAEFGNQQLEVLRERVRLKRT